MLTGVPIAIGAVMSGVLITMVNAWMNTPNGFNIPTYLATQTITNIQPFAVFSTPSTWIEVSHVITSSYFAGILVFAAYIAYMLLKTKESATILYYKKGMRLLLVLSIIFTVLSIYTGIVSIATLVN